LRGAGPGRCHEFPLGHKPSRCAASSRWKAGSPKSTRELWARLK
jgi:hypothetical protein